MRKKKEIGGELKGKEKGEGKVKVKRRGRKGKWEGKDLIGRKVFCSAPKTLLKLTATGPAK